MKALKEKRISLRSLWRRGLVILSLFALVFASCGDSSSDEPSSGPRVVSISIVDGPANNQYYGKPVDKTGVSLWVKYSDGTAGPAKDITKFTTVPRVVTGSYADWSEGQDGFSTYNGCWLFYEGAKAWLSFDDVKVYPIVRKDTTWNWDANPATGSWQWNDRGSSDVGLNLVGKLAKTEYYADDDTFDFSGLELWADYDTDDGIQPEKLSFGDVTWKILPDYSHKNDDGTYKGYVCVTVGEFIDEYFFDDTPGIYWYCEGITALRQLDKVFTVRDKDAIELIDPPEKLDEFFLWEDNSRDAWLEKLEKASLKVTYTNGQPKTFKIADLAKNTRIWYNENPNYAANWPEWTYKVDGAVIDYDFTVIPFANKFDKKTSPALTVYYRGGRIKVPVNVYTTLVSVAVEPKNPGELSYTPGAGRDNDVDNGKEGPAELAKLLSVKATYSTTDKSSSTEVPLDYWFSLSDAKLLKAIENGYVYETLDASGNDIIRVAYGPYYLFGTSADADLDTDDPTDPNALSTYSKSYAKWVKAKGSITQNITVRHSLDAPYVVKYIESEYEYTVLPNGEGAPTTWFSVKQSQSKAAKQSVTWVK